MKKVLLMGKSGSGKTTMKTLIFGDYTLNDTKRLHETSDTEITHIKIVKNLIISLWDCGGHEKSLSENKSIPQSDNTFCNVDILIFVFDITNRDQDFANNFKYYDTCVKAIDKNSPSAKVYCLINKLDLFQNDGLLHESENVLLKYKNIICNLSNSIECTFFQTSMNNETLSMAWSKIIQPLLPNTQKIHKNLEVIADFMECKEVILFEQNTFLIVALYVRDLSEGCNRPYKMTKVLKTLKLKCKVLNATMKMFELRVGGISLFIDIVTPDLYMVLVIPDRKISSLLVSMNIKNIRTYYKTLELASELTQPCSSKLEN